MSTVAEDLAKCQAYLALRSTEIYRLFSEVVAEYPKDYETAGYPIEKDPARALRWEHMVAFARQSLYTPAIDAKIANNEPITGLDVIQAQVAAGKLVLKPGLVLDDKGLEVIAVAVDPIVEAAP